MVINTQTAIVVLNAQRNFKRFLMQIHTMIQIKLNSRLIHLHQTINWLAKASACTFQIAACLFRKRCKVYVALTRILAEIEKNSAALLLLIVNQQINA